MTARARAASLSAASIDSPPPSPTIRYDSERSPLERRGSLDPPDVPTLLRQKRKWWRRGWTLPTTSRPLRITLMVASIAMSAVQANGVYCWPTYGPVVKEALGLTKTQEQTIVAGGILGVYLCAAPVGSLVDRWGPRAGSLLSACLASAGYFAFAAILKAADKSNENTYLALTACYFSIGAATVGSYFAALTTASLSFPSHPTLSLSLPLALIGLSPLVLASFSNLPAFTVPGHDVDAVKFLTFLGFFSVCVNLFAAMFMRVTLPIPKDTYDDDTDSEYDAYESNIADLSASLHLDERTPLLIGGPEAAREDVEAEMQGKDVVRWTTVSLVRNPGFWAFGLIVTGCIGPSETLIASIGAVVTALLPPDESLSFKSALAVFSQWTMPTTTSTLTKASALALRNKHVFILSISSTLARLVTGFAADYLAPAPVAVPARRDEPDGPSHYFVQRDPVIMRRSTFAALCAAALAAVYAWNAATLDSEAMLWVLSGGVGALYGALFTLTPAIVSTHFGPTNFGLAWGMVSYFPALGSAVFSYLFAYLATSDADATPLSVVEKSCLGPGCFDASFWIAAAGSAIAAIGMFFIGPRWKV